MSRVRQSVPCHSVWMPAAGSWTWRGWLSSADSAVNGGAWVSGPVPLSRLGVDTDRAGTWPNTQQRTRAAAVKRLLPYSTTGEGIPQVSSAGKVSFLLERPDEWEKEDGDEQRLSCWSWQKLTGKRPSIPAAWPNAVCSPIGSKQDHDWKTFTVNEAFYI